jgi:hypothetical protein
MFSTMLPLDADAETRARHEQVLESVHFSPEAHSH